MSVQPSDFPAADGLNDAADEAATRYVRFSCAPAIGTHADGTFERLRHAVTDAVQTLTTAASVGNELIAAELMDLVDKWESHEPSDFSDWERGKEAGLLRAADDLREVLMDRGLMTVWGNH